MFERLEANGWKQAVTPVAKEPQMKKLLLLCLPALLLLASCHIHQVDTPFLAKFENMLYTDISVEVDGYGSAVIAPGETVTFEIDKDDQSYHYEAETHGSSNSGEQLGLVMEWSRTRSISGNSYTTYLITDENMFFLKMRNTGHHDLHPLYVNFGLIAQTLDDITIPGNGVLYNTGYYKAFTNTRVQANWSDLPSDYTYWEQGNHFNFPWTENQAVTLLNTFKKDAAPEQGFKVESKLVDHRSDESFGLDAGIPRENN